MKDNRISLEFDDGSTSEVEVLEQTSIGNINYLLVKEINDGTEAEGEEESEALVYIMKQIGTDGDDAVYEEVEDEEEFYSIARVFEQLLGDVELEFE
ncbi:MAG: DUF1292 domain-containing protein [Lachnospiraceae bacterium]|nr:DUF1292 domain-containing protein [Lachnospiraceae bacterium]